MRRSVRGLRLSRKILLGPKPDSVSRNRSSSWSEQNLHFSEQQKRSFVVVVVFVVDVVVVAVDDDEVEQATEVLERQSGQTLIW